MLNQELRIKNQESRTGFTLVEVIIYLAIVSTILVSISYLIIDIISGQTKSLAGAEVNYNIRFISAQLARDIKSAQNIGSISADTLVLALPGDDITYNFDAGNQKITRQLGVATPEDLNTTQVEVTGSFDDNSYLQRSKNVGIGLTVVYKNPSNLPDYNVSSIITLSLELKGKR